jgi:CDP-diacylglycerol--serine O-phosphatidyltransferase
MKLLKLISVADIFTTINALLGLGSIIATIYDLYVLAINLILLGVIIDGVDGVFARRFSKKWYLGDYLDLMSDTVTFCLAPAVLMFKVYFDPADLSNWTAHLLDYNKAPLLIPTACGAIVVTGILRLARFCYQSPFLGDYFIGIPTPSAATTLSLLLLLSLRMGDPEHWTIPPLVVGVIALALAYLMVCDVRYLKMKGKIEWIAGALVLMAVLLNWVMEIVTIVFVASLIYIIGGPFALRRKELKEAGGKGRKVKGKKKDKRRKRLPKRKKGRRKDRDG